jgi:transposase
LRLIKLPPRSPELNPAEHIWEELREKNFANKACRDLVIEPNISGDFGLTEGVRMIK